VPQDRCSKIAEAEAVVSVNEQKWLVMHVHVQMMRLDELRGPPTLGSQDRCVDNGYECVATIEARCEGYSYDFAATAKSTT
jgi:hypothetical protein